MAELDQSLLDQPFDFNSMDLPDFLKFDEQLSALEDQSILNPSAIDRFLIGDAASTKQAASWEPSISQLEEDFQANIDPALLPTFDASLDAFTPLPSLEVTEASMFDPSTGVEWQPMENTQTSIDPTLLNPFDFVLDPFAVQTPLFSNDVIFPPESIGSSTNTMAFSPEVSHSFLEPFGHRTSDRRSAENTSTIFRHPATRPTHGRTKIDQPRVNGDGCSCGLCKGGPVSLASLRNKVGKARRKSRVERTTRNTKVEKATRNIRIEKSSKKTKVRKTGRVTKHKVKKVTPQYESEDSDSSLSSLPDSDAAEDLREPEYRPRPTARTRRAAAPKRVRKIGKVAAAKDTPKELGIEMERWW
ncbi:MAG: hypothetical protein Q9188_001477 [Gyalolechia gomerana]